MRARTILLFAAVWLSSVGGYVAGVWLLTRLAAHQPWVAPFIFMDTKGPADAFSLKSALIQPTAFTVALLFCLALEAAFLGHDNSSAKRLVERKTESARVDLFYVLLKLTGGVNLIAFMLSFGTLFWVVNQIHRVCDIRVLQYVPSFVGQFAIVYLINSLIAYWGHRLMHTKWMWEIHKVHHAAEEMNCVTPLRNHPIDHVIMTLLNAFPVALLGADKGVILVYYAVNMVYQAMVHTEVNLPLQRWFDAVWITPAAHRVHHSNRRDHWDANFGVLTIWDRVFGTYHAPAPDEKLTYGVDHGELFNRPQYVREVFANVARWVGLAPKSDPPRRDKTLPFPKRPERPLKKSA